MEVLGIEPRASCMLSMRSTTELYPRMFLQCQVLILNPVRYLVVSGRTAGLYLLKLLADTVMVALKRRWHPTPVLLPGKSHGQRSLVGCSPWGHEKSDATERLPFHFSLSCIGEGNATHSSVLAWRIPGMGEPGGLPSMGSHRVGHD